MQTKSIVYYFTLTSPWAYLGHSHLLQIAQRQGCTIDYRPIGLGQIFPQTGGLPVARRAPARQAYRLMELQRWRATRGIHISLAPKYFPFDVSLVDRVLVAILAGGHAPDAFVIHAFAAVFAQDRNMADAQEIDSVLQAAGLNAGALLAQAASTQIMEQYQGNIDQALAAGIFGSPSYVLDGEIFWGQDRLDLLEEALTSGRKPYLAQ